MAKQAPASKGSRSIRMPEDGFAIICTNEAQLLFVCGFSTDDPGGEVIWDYESPKMSLKLSTAVSREIFARKLYTRLLAPKGMCFVRVELKDGFLVGMIGDVEVLRINTRSQINKASANSARIMAKACGMSDAEMAPMFAYPVAPSTLSVDTTT
jgi:hypothetical protein